MDVEGEEGVELEVGGRVRLAGDIASEVIKGHVK